MKTISIPPIAEREKLVQKSPQELVEIILCQQEIIQKLMEEIERIKTNASSDSSSSSKPPSSDLHKRSEKSPTTDESEAPEGKRRPGGQPGHKGKTRKGFGRVDRYEVVRPRLCPECGGQEFADSPVKVRYQQIAELMEPAIEVIEYEHQCCECLGCGAWVWGVLPDGVVGAQSLGARLQALLVWLGNYGHLSYEKQQELLQELGQIAVGTGTLQVTNARMSEIVKPAVERLGDWVKQSAHVQVDETPWLVKGIKEWMWVACGVGFCLFHAADTRSRVELETLLGKSFAGVLSSDDFSVYNGYEVRAQQKCMAHLRRHFKKVLKLKHGNNPQLGKVFIDLIDAAFTAHRQWRETQDACAYRSWAEDFKIEVQTVLAQWLPKAGYAAGLLLRSLRDKAQQWWYFLDHPEVPPDNNRSERSLRLAVTKRKVCGGSRSMEGFAQTAILLTVIQTCRAQGRSVFEFFKQALMTASSFNDLTMPSLIPDTST
jgi:transposase